VLIALFLVPILELFGPGMGQVVGLGMLVVLGILAIAAVSRVILLFPALAIGAGRSLSDILEMSRPIWLRLTILIFASIVLTTLLSWPLTWLMEVSASPVAAVI